MKKSSQRKMVKERWNQMAGRNWDFEKSPVKEQALSKRQKIV